MALFAKNVSPDGKPEVLIVLPDGKVEFAVTAQQLWEAVQRAAKMSHTFTKIEEGRKATNWIGERTEGLALARQDAAERTRLAVEAYTQRHGVQFFAPRKAGGLDPAAPKARRTAPKGVLTADGATALLAELGL